MKRTHVIHAIVFALVIVGVLSPAVSSAQSILAQESTVSTTVPALASVEDRVREYFADIPVMIEIARCESKFRQFTDSGSVLRGGASGQFVGIFQFMESIHSSVARTLGHDLATVDGNLAYARHLYTQQGTKPWTSCVPTVLPSTDAQLQLQIELMTKLIGLLQELLKLKLADH
jgi:hypothetical protein